MNYVTKEGMAKLVAQLKELREVERPAVIERLNAARKHGDLRENGDYKAAKEDLSILDDKIAQLTMLISDSSIIEKNDMKTDVVSILHTVKVKDHSRDREIEYTLVSESEADPAEFKISAESPIGKSLLGKKVGDKFPVKIPAGELEFEILEIR